MCVLTSLIYGLVTGGKTPVAGVPFVIPTYEGTILLGAIGAFIAVLVYAFAKVRATPADYDPRFSYDSFGVYVTCAEAERSRIVEMLEKAGAVEIDEH
jgi:hypothetical protein